MVKKASQMGFIDKVFVGTLLTVFGGIVLHAPLTVWLGTQFPGAELLIKSWKEILLLFAIVLAGVVIVRRRQWGVIKNPILLLMLAYAILHIVLVVVFGGTPEAIIAGLMIDLRYMLFFALIYIAFSLYPALRKPFIVVGVAGALIVTVFAVLQVMVLPRDALTTIGYSETTIQPYLTVDENEDFVRINSTLRGPNPLGAYAVIVMGAVLAAWLWARQTITKKRLTWLVLVLGIGSVVALWFSYSRSALLAALVVIGGLVLVRYWSKIRTWMLIVAAFVVMTIGGLAFLARDSYFISNILLHENDTTGAEVSSNDAHIESFGEGTERLITQPFGAGVGSTGSASLYSDEPFIVENQRLYVAHETGWIGMGLYLAIFLLVIHGLWRRRRDWLAIGVLASGVGMAIIGTLLPVWADDTVSLVWWGLAAVVLGGAYGRTLNKTTKRTT